MLRDLLHEQRFEDLGSLREALKRRCVRLRLRGYARLVDGALDLVGSNTRLVHASRPVAATAPRPERELSPAAARDALAAVFDRIRTRLFA